MSDEYRQKIIGDPVHGGIPVSRLEQRLIDSRSFQRLRGLKQLGLASLVYPNATHTRFAHSLGVFRIMSRVIDLFVDRGHFDNEDRRKLRAAALLHDIGHYPYSHLMEFVDRDPLRPKLLGAQSDSPKVVNKGEALRYPSHEKIGELIITGRPDVRQLLENEGIDPVEIAAMIRGEHSKPAYNRLTHSSLDVDRMDYLVRDSLGTGVPYGRIDIEYLLSNLVVYEDQSGDGPPTHDVVLAQKATAAAEHFLIARYFMHKVVYFHKTTFGFEALLRQILFMMRSAGRVPKGGSEIEELLTDNSRFFDFHDGFVDRHVREAAADGPSELAELCEALLTRTPPKLVYEVTSLRASDGEHSNEYALFRSQKERKIRELADSSGIPIPFWIWEDLPKDVSFESMGPMVALSEVEDLNPEEAAELIRVVGRDGNVCRLVEDRTSILHHLSKLRLQASRLYLARRVSEETMNEIRRHVAAWRSTG